MNLTSNRHDFGAVHESMEQCVENDLLAMAASVVLEGQDVVDFHMTGHQDREAGIPIAEDSIYRIFSNSKIVTSVAAMTLWEEGGFRLDDPLYEYMPEFADVAVLRHGAERVDEVEPLEHPATVRQLMCHNAGFSYGNFAESLVDPLYREAGVMSPTTSLDEMVVKLADVPLAYQPGRRWQYSISTDVLGALIQRISGRAFGDYLREHIFEPLGMVDTDFHVPPEKQARLCANYVPIEPTDPMEPGLKVVPDAVLGGYLEPKAMQSGGAGLVGTIGDYTRFIQMLIGDGTLDGVTVLRPDTVTLMRTNQLPDGVGVQLPNWFMPDTVFGLGLALKQAPRPGEPDTAIDEYHWGGVAGTHSWVAPRANVAGIIFTQRLPGFFHPFSHDFKRLVYQAVS